ncbi:MAG: tripartite tricarboxylate transporter TctB family protein [Deltaproteobacteria bacterium]|nr:tripartite tricarboxylate transporter TctB family protein [Deltaproteobacteria bacterium]
MKHQDQYASIFWFILGGIITFSSFYYGVGSFSKPGPGFITFLAGAGLTILSVILFVLSRSKKEDRLSLKQLWVGGQTGKAFYVMGLLIVYMLFVVPSGFLISTFILLSLLFRVQGNYSVKNTILLASLSTAVSFIIFDIWLGVRLPRGFIGYFIF